MKNCLNINYQVGNFLTESNINTYRLILIAGTLNNLFLFYTIRYNTIFTLIIF